MDIDHEPSDCFDSGRLFYSPSDAKIRRDIFEQVGTNSQLSVPDDFIVLVQ